MKCSWVINLFFLDISFDVRVLTVYTADRGVILNKTDF